MPKLPTYYYDHNAHQMLPTLREITIYVDTSAFQSNAAQHSDDKSVAEHAAIEKLKAGEASARYKLFASSLTEREISNTKDQSQRANLRKDHDTLGKVAQNERLLGFNTVFDWTGGFVCSPIMSDIQDEQTRDELIEIGLSRDDADHISQALSNNCDYFLTRDIKTIIKKYRDDIEKRFPIKIRTPVEMVGKLQSLGQSGERQ